MPTVGTMFRAVVMVVVGIAAVKGWQQYGPETADMKAMALRALEAAQTALKEGQTGTGNTSTLAADPRVAPPSAPPVPPVVPPATNLAPAPPFFATAPPAEAGSALPANFNPPAEAAPHEPATLAAAPAAQEPQRLTVLLAKLEELGGADPQLTPWGASGQMYRFCCRAALANMPDHARHFEAVAAEPEAAVEQVVAKVETWRTAQREQASLQ